MTTQLYICPTMRLAPELSEAARIVGRQSKQHPYGPPKWKVPDDWGIMDKNKRRYGGRGNRGQIGLLAQEPNEPAPPRDALLGTNLHNLHPVGQRPADVKERFTYAESIVDCGVRPSQARHNGEALFVPGCRGGINFA